MSCGLLMSYGFLINTDSGNGLVPSWQQAITSVNADLSSIEHLGINFSEILIKNDNFHPIKFIWKCHL